MRQFRCFDKSIRGASWSGPACRPRHNGCNADEAEGCDCQKDQSRAAMVHDCAENQRGCNPANIEAGRDKSEHLAERPWRGDLAHDHIARGHNDAREEATNCHRRNQGKSKPDRSTRRAQSRSPSPSARWWQLRRDVCVRPTRNPPNSTPIADNRRFADKAALAIVNGVP